jgi:putative phage-type endonuclease
MTAATDLVTPAARLILPADAPRPQWLAARRRGIGGSDALAVLGLSAYSSRYSVWADKSGLLREQDDREAMRWGRLLEPVIAEQFSERTGLDTISCGLMGNVDRDWQLASVDRLTADGGVLEIKTTSQYRAGDWDDEQLADHAEAQLQHYLSVTGLDHGYAAALIGGQRLEIRHVVRDDRLIALMVEAEAELWDMVQTGTAPALDGSDASLRALAEIYPYAADRGIELPPAAVEALYRYVDASASETAAKKAKAADKALVCGLLKDAERGTYGEHDVVTWKNTGAFAADKFTTDHPDLAAACQTSVLDEHTVKARHPDLYAAYRSRRFHIVKKGLT